MSNLNGGRAVGGWAILAVALAVPGFLFYNWWSHMKAEHEKSTSARSSKAKSDKTIFQTSTTSRLSNPMAPASTPVTPQHTTVKSSPEKAPPAVTAAPASEGVPAAMPASSEATLPASAPVETTASEASPTLSRDPMMSPMDLVRIREEEIRSKEEAERIRRSAQDYNHARNRERPIESAVELQGIIATHGGAPLAIVNGSTVKLGDQISVPGHAARVKIIKIGSATVTFEYKKKRFNKTVNTQ